MISKESDIIKLAEKVAFFFDLDGTIYLGNRLFEGIINLIEWLKVNDKHFFFLTNNSSRSTSMYLEKLNNFGLKISRENIIVSQHPTIAYLKENNLKRVFLMGTQSLKDEFSQEAFILTEEDPEILVLAFDQELTYDRLVKASYLLQEDIPYIATHLDSRCPTEKGYIPDAGGIAALLSKTTNRMPRVFGKPNKEMVLFKLEQLNLPTSDAIIFGDRLYTDIKMGLKAGIDTCLVLSGETTLKMVKESKYKPTYIIEGIWQFQALLNDS